MHRLGFWTQSLWVDTRQEYGLSESEAFDFYLALRWTLCCKHETLSSLLRHSKRWKIQSDETPLSSVKLVLCGWIVWVFCCRMVTYSLVSGLAGLWAAFAFSGFSWWHHHCWYSEELMDHQPHGCWPLKYLGYVKTTQSFVYSARLSFLFS